VPAAAEGITVSSLLADRSFAPITNADLRRLGRLAAEDRAGLFARSSRTEHLYRDRLFAVALCQGAALHRLNGTNGVKDFDVWSFYVAHPEGPYPPRRNGTADFADPKFGTTPGFEDFVGRRVDLLGRSYTFKPSEDVAQALRGYLRKASTDTARFLAEKAMILIEPEDRLGEVVWPVAA
jgi:hypothetical protein